MTCEYRFNTFKKENDYVVFDYEQIKFNLKYHVLPNYKKNIYYDVVIDKEIDYFINNLTGTVIKSSLKEVGGNCDFCIEFKGGGQYHFNEDIYLNKCQLAHNEDDARAILYIYIKQAIEELQLSWFKQFKNILNQKSLVIKLLNLSSM